MSEAVVDSASPQETHALGVRLGGLLQDGHFIGLTGELGAGKTHFVRGVAVGAGVAPSEVSSPTFAIVQPYRGRILLHHADLYRLRDADDLYATGFHDLLAGLGAMLVEWVEQIPEAAPREGLRIRITVTAEEGRRIEASAAGAVHERLLAEWLGGTG